MQSWMVVETFEDTMRCYHAEELAQRIADGTWESWNAEIATRAEEIISTHVAMTTHRHPLPTDDDARLATLRTLHMEGRELAIEELVSYLVPADVDDTIDDDGDDDDDLVEDDDDTIDDDDDIIDHDADHDVDGLEQYD